MCIAPHTTTSAAPHPALPPTSYADVMCMFLCHSTTLLLVHPTPTSPPPRVVAPYNMVNHILRTVRYFSNSFQMEAAEAEEAKRQEEAEGQRREEDVRDAPFVATPTPGALVPKGSGVVEAPSPADASPETGSSGGSGVDKVKGLLRMEEDHHAGRGHDDASHVEKKVVGPTNAGTSPVTDPEQHIASTTTGAPQTVDSSTNAAVRYRPPSLRTPEGELRQILLKFKAHSAELVPNEFYHRGGLIVHPETRNDGGPRHFCPDYFANQECKHWTSCVAPLPFSTKNGPDNYDYEVNPETCPICRDAHCVDELSTYTKEEIAEEAAKIFFRFRDITTEGRRLFQHDLTVHEQRLVLDGNFHNVKNPNGIWHARMRFAVNMRLPLAEFYPKNRRIVDRGKFYSKQWFACTISIMFIPLYYHVYRIFKLVVQSII